MDERIIALVTAYEPTEKDVANIAAFSKQVHSIYIIDNSKINHRNLFENISNANYIFSGENLGISAAYNYVLENPNNDFKDKDFIIFFDQDSKIKNNHINKLIEEYEEIEKRKIHLGCLGPAFYNTSNKRVEFPHLKRKITKNTFAVNNIITSSMLTRFENLRSIGYWNSNLFLDYTDWDLCWRFNQNNMVCAMSKDVIMEHSVGLGQKKIGIINLRVSTPIREYYQIRDALYLLRENYVPIKMRVRLFEYTSLVPFLHALFLDNKTVRIKYSKLGREDFKKGIHGELIKECERK